METETIVLLHGMMRGCADMWPLALYLRRRGYRVLNIGYPARKMGLNDLAAWLDGRLNGDPHARSARRLHFVTHSLGGLLARYYIAAYRPDNLGRVVMLGPPNAGSAWADRLSIHRMLAPLFRWGFGPVGPELATRHTHGCVDCDFELGIIAGRRSIMPFAARILNGEHDGMVAVSSTRLDGMTDHLVMDTTHTYMITRPAVWRQIAAFLRDGRFACGVSPVTPK